MARVLESLDRDAVGPVAGGQPRFLLQVADEVGRLSDRVPDGGQKEAALRALGEDQPVAPRHQRGDQRPLRCDQERLRCAEQRQIEIEPGELVLGQRHEARVVESRAERVVGDIGGEPAPRPGAADAAAELAMAMERDEAGAGCRECGRQCALPDRERRAVDEPVPHRGDGEVEQRLALIGDQCVERRGEGGLAHPTTQAPYPTTSPRGPAVSPELRRSTVCAARPRARAICRSPAIGVRPHASS